jgi:GGDEF domain-containing protein
VRTRAESLRKGFRGVPLDRGSGIDKGQRTISLSFGVAVFPDNGQSVEGLLRAANEALYQAKMDGKIAWWWLKAVRRRRLTAHNSRLIANGGWLLTYGKRTRTQKRPLRQWP